MIVDAHVHILPPQLRARRDEVARGEAWFAACHDGERAIAGADDLLTEMDAAGVDHAICLGWPFAAAALRDETNAYLAEMQRAHPDRITGFGIINPAAMTATDELQRCADLGLRGIGELNCDAQGFALDDPRVSEAAALSAQLQLPWTLHCSEPVGHLYAGKGTTTPDLVARFALLHPELQLVCAHIGGGLPFFAHMPEIAALCKKLWFDTSATPFLYAPSAFRTVIDLCGADRLLFGSDFPLLRTARYTAAFADAHLTEHEVEAVMGGNAAALLRLAS